jgi:1-acyl-sn-glycerol-3-phosphate acyltransferase
MSGRNAERGYSPAWRQFTKIILPPLIHALMRQKVRGRQPLPPEGGLIIAPNHLSYADWLAIALFTHQSGRYPVFLIKSGVFGVKFIGSFLRKLGQLPVYRTQADAALVLRDAERDLRRGACVIVYPEGTASRDPDQWPMVARTGVARLALATGAPVIPVAQWGAQDVLPYGEKKPRLFPRKTAQIISGPPVDLSQFEGQPLNRDTLRAATAAIMADVTRLLAGLREQEPPAVPYDPAAARRAAAAAEGAPAAEAAHDADEAEKGLTG